jgi:hypothetical protein
VETNSKILALNVLKECPLFLVKVSLKEDKVAGKELLCNTGKKLNRVFTALDHNFDFILGMIAAA